MLRNGKVISLIKEAMFMASWYWLLWLSYAIAITGESKVWLSHNICPPSRSDKSSLVYSYQGSLSKLGTWFFMWHTKGRGLCLTFLAVEVPWTGTWGLDVNIVSAPFQAFLNNNKKGEDVAAVISSFQLPRIDILWSRRQNDHPTGSAKPCLLNWKSN